MVHGDCSSRGCYAMTDEQIAEIYSLGRESFFGGQKSFQLQAYPFKMTPINMAKHRNNPNMPFWKMIKEGYDHFEVTRQEPKVDFCEKKYVFDAIRAPNATRDPVFDASAKCPAYAIPEEVADAVREKQQHGSGRDRQADRQGTPVARMNTGIDGGMNKVFAARVPDGNTGLSEGGDSQGLSVLALSRAPGTIPSHVNPPRAPATPSDNLLQGAPEEPRLAAAPAPTAGTDAGRQRGADRADPTASSPASPARSASAAAPMRPPPQARTAAAREAEGDRGQAHRTRRRVRKPPRRRPPSTEAGRRRQAGAETVGLRCAGAQPRAPAAAVRSRDQRRSCRRTRSTAALGR